MMKPIVLAAVVDGPLTPEAIAHASSSRAADFLHVRSSGTVGATLRFEGIVRTAEPDPNTIGSTRDLQALDYQTYDPMAERELGLLSERICQQFALRSILAVHSRGRVGVGEVSFMLEVTSAHRAEALEAMAAFINRLKQDVPIWKRAVWA